MLMDNGAKSEGKRVFICSPYRPRGETEKERQADLEKNLKIAREACSYALGHGFIPYAPHLYFPQFLSDEDAGEREKGIRCGLKWLAQCDELWVIGSRVTEGMKTEIRTAEEAGIPVRQMLFSEDLIDALCEMWFGFTLSD